MRIVGHHSRWTLKIVDHPLPCARIVGEQFCDAPTRYVLSIKDYYAVAVCYRHLPEWAKDMLNEFWKFGKRRGQECGSSGQLTQTASNASY